MDEGKVRPVLFPTYTPPVINPQGIPVASAKHAAFLMKTIKQMGKIVSRKMPTHGKRGLRHSQSVRIKHRKIGYQ